MPVHICHFKLTRKSNSTLSYVINNILFATTHTITIKTDFRRKNKRRKTKTNWWKKQTRITVSQTMHNHFGPLDVTHSTCRAHCDFINTYWLVIITVSEVCYSNTHTHTDRQRELQTSEVTASSVAWLLNGGTHMLLS